MCVWFLPPSLSGAHPWSLPQSEPTADTCWTWWRRRRTWIGLSMGTSQTGTEHVRRPRRVGHWRETTLPGMYATGTLGEFLRQPRVSHPASVVGGDGARADLGSIAAWMHQSSVRSCPAVSWSGFTSSGTSRVGPACFRPVGRALGHVRTRWVRSHGLAGSVDTRGVSTSRLSMPVARGKCRRFSSSFKSISGDPSGGRLERGRCLKWSSPRA